MTSSLQTRSRPVNPPVNGKLAGRVAFVTGRTRGIGAAIARSLDGQGATVAEVIEAAADASSFITGQVWSVNGGMDM